MEQKFIKFFEKVNQIRKEAIDLDGSPKEKMDYLINKMTVLLTGDEYEIRKAYDNKVLKTIPFIDSIEEYQLTHITHMGEEIPLDERIEGIVFHTLVLFDGDSSLNNFEQIIVVDKKTKTCLIEKNEFIELHHEWCKYLNNKEGE